MVAETSVEKMFNFGQESGCRLFIRYFARLGLQHQPAVSCEILAPG